MQNFIEEVLPEISLEQACAHLSVENESTDDIKRIYYGAELKDLQE